MKKNSKKGIEFVFDLFEATRHQKFRQVILPKELVSYASRLYALYEQNPALVVPEGELIPEIKPSSQDAVFSFSGGKDSLAAFLLHKDKFEPNIICTYIQGVSPKYPEEFSRAKQIATTLDIKLSVLKLEVDNKTWLPESVIKNQLIYAMILDNRQTLPKAIGFGGTKAVGPQSMAFYHDSPSAFELFHSFAQVGWGQHELLEFVEDEIESYRIIDAKRPDLFNLLTSCMCAADEKSVIRKNIQGKFRVILENEYDCGQCYKCAEKAMISKKFFHRTYSEEYIRFCEEVLIDKVNSPYHMNGIPKDYLAKLDIKIR